MNLVAVVSGVNQKRPLDVIVDLAEDRADFFVNIYAAGISVCVPGKRSPLAAMSRYPRGCVRVRSWSRLP